MSTQQETVPMVDIMSNELDYHTQTSIHSDIIYRTISPKDSQTCTLSQSGSPTAITFLVPPTVHNLAKSFLSFQLQLQGQGSGTYTCINANFQTVFSRIRYFDQNGGAVWLDLSNYSKAMSLLLPACTRLSTFLTKSFYTPLITTNSANSTPYPINDISRFMGQYTLTATTGSTGITQTGVAVATLVAPNNYAPTGTNSVVDLFPFNPYTSRRQFLIDSFGTATTGSTNYLDVNLPFHSFVGTVLATDKLIYTPNTMQLDLTFNSTDSFLTVCTSANNPSTGAGSFVGSAIVANIKLTLATENDPSVVMAISDGVRRSGIEMLTPWMTATANLQPTSQYHSFQQTLSTSLGQNLLGIMIAPFPATASGTTAFMYHSHNRGNITSLFSKIDSIDVSNPAGYNILAGDDYQLSAGNFLRGSAVQTLGEYANAEWFYLESFVGRRALWSLDWLAQDGRSLQKGGVYQFSAYLSANTSYNYLMLILGQKVLRIGAGPSACY